MLKNSNKIKAMFFILLAFIMLPFFAYIGIVYEDYLSDSFALFMGFTVLFLGGVVSFVFLSVYYTDQHQESQYFKSKIMMDTNIEEAKKLRAKNAKQI